MTTRLKRPARDFKFQVSRTKAFPLPRGIFHFGLASTDEAEPQGCDWFQKRDLDVTFSTIRSLVVKCLKKRWKHVDEALGGVAMVKACLYKFVPFLEYCPVVHHTTITTSLTSIEQNHHILHLRPNQP